MRQGALSETWWQQSHIFEEHQLSTALHSTNARLSHPQMHPRSGAYSTDSHLSAPPTRYDRRPHHQDLRNSQSDTWQGTPTETAQVSSQPLPCVLQCILSAVCALMRAVCTSDCSLCTHECCVCTSDCTGEPLALQCTAALLLHCLAPH